MTSADLSQAELRQRASGLLASGRLPPGEPSATWAGSGRGERCCVCQVVVNQDEIGFDLSFRMPEREVELHMHNRCRIAWEHARCAGSATVRAAAP